jgi:hypothetical protein
LGRRLRSILDEAGQLGEFLNHPGRSNECPWATSNLHQALTHKILDRRADRGPANVKLANDFLFRWELCADSQLTARNPVYQKISDFGVKRLPA